MSLVLLAICVVLVLLLVVKLSPFVSEQWKAAKTVQNIPGPQVYPLVGSFYCVTGPIEHLIDKGYELWTKYGHIFKIRFAHWCAVVVTDPDDLQVVFTSPHTQDKIDLCYDALQPMLGMGLINLNGEDYRRHRKAITASLHLQILQDFVYTFRVNAENLSKRLESYAESGKVFNVAPFVGDCANLNVCETVLSTDVAGMDEKRESYVSNAYKSSKLMFWRCMRPWYWVDAIFKLFSSRYKEYYAVATTMSNYVAEVLELKVRQASEAPAKTAEKRRLTFLEHFLRSEEGYVMNKSELLDELKTLMFTASETSAGLMSCFLVSISLYPDVQEKIHQELDDIFGDDPKRQVTPNDIPRLLYMEQVLKEVLRFFPAAPVFGRQVTEQVSLPSGYILPRGTAILIHPALTHRNEFWFPDADRFDPERFTPEASRGRHPYAFVPFSAGSRSCVGQKYGMMFVKTLAATLLRKYAILPDPNGPKHVRDLKLTVGITLAVTHGANIRLQRRSTEGRVSPS